MIFFKGNKNKIILVSVTIILVVIMAVSSADRKGAPIVSDTFGVLLSPLQSAAGYISDCLSYGKDRGKYENENTILKQQLITAKRMRQIMSVLRQKMTSSDQCLNFRNPQRNMFL